VAAKQRVAERYAKAIYAALADIPDFDQLVTELTELAALVKDNSDFAAFLRNPVISEREKLQTLETVLPDNVHADLKRILQFLHNKKRLSFMGNIIAALQQLRNRETGVREAEVASAVPLKAEQLQQLRSIWQARTGDTFVFREFVRPDLLAGLAVRVDDTVYDATLRHKLGRMRKLLTEKQ
jgi:F-type H+-transporting ATPase subunit delta